MTMQSGSFAAIQEAEEEGHRALRAAYDCFIAEDRAGLRQALSYWHQLNARIDKLRIGQDVYRPAAFYTRFQEYQPVEDISSDMLAVFAVKWKSRFRDAGFEEFSDASDDAIEAFLDANLPQAWDCGYDLLICVGYSERLEAWLEKIGQKRVIFVDRDMPDAVLARQTEFKYGRTITDIPQSYLVRNRSVQVIAAKPGISDITKKACLDWTVNIYAAVSTLLHFSADWIENQFANLPAALNGFNLFSQKQAFAGRDVLLVSPGPSLSNDIEMVAKASQTHLVCAVSWAYRKLLAHNIMPDFVLVSDASLSAEDLFGGLDVSECCLIASSAVKPEVTSLPFKQVIFIETGDLMVANLQALTGLQACNYAAGSSSIIGMRVFAEQGAASLALVGNDLAVQGDAIYADDTFVTEGQKALLARKQREGTVIVDAIGGGRVATKENYNQFIYQFGNYAAVYRQENIACALFNCSSFGAYIDGFEHIGLADYLARTAAAGSAEKALQPVLEKLAGGSEEWRVAPALTAALKDALDACLDGLHKMNKKAKKMALLSEAQRQLFLQQEESLFNRLETLTVINCLCVEASEKIVNAEFASAEQADRARLEFYQEIGSVIRSYKAALQKFESQLAHAPLA